MTLDEIDARLRAVWPYLGSSVKATRDAAWVRIDALLEQRFELQTATLSEPEAQV